MLRRVADRFTGHRERDRIDVQYRKAYEGVDVLDEEFSGWEDQGVWPASGTEESPSDPPNATPGP